MKRIICLLLALMLTIFTFACGSDNKSKETTSGSKNNASQSGDTKKPNNEMEEKDKTYQQAHDLMLAKKYDEAIALFETLNGYHSADNMIKECKYSKALHLLAGKQYEAAYNTLLQVKNYSDANDILEDFVWRYTKMTDSNSAGADMTYHYTYTYDDNGYLIAYDYSSEYFSNEYTYVNEFDKDGRLCKAAATSDAGFSNTIVYEYNDKGLISYERRDSGSYTEEYLYFYDDEGRLIREEYPNNKDVMYYTYDDHGNLLTKAFDDSTDRHDYTDTYENTYNEAGLLVKCVVSDGENSCTYEYQYDSNHNVVQEDFESFGNVKTKVYSEFKCFYIPNYAAPPHQ